MLSSSFPQNHVPPLTVSFLSPFKCQTSNFQRTGGGYSFSILCMNNSTLNMFGPESHRALYIGVFCYCGAKLSLKIADGQAHNTYFVSLPDGYSQQKLPPQSGRHVGFKWSNRSILPPTGCVQSLSARPAMCRRRTERTLTGLFWSAGHPRTQASEWTCGFGTGSELSPSCISTGV